MINPEDLPELFASLGIRRDYGDLDLDGFELERPKWLLHKPTQAPERAV